MLAPSEPVCLLCDAPMDEERSPVRSKSALELLADECAAPMEVGEDVEQGFGLGLPNSHSA